VGALLIILVVERHEIEHAFQKITEKRGEAEKPKPGEAPMQGPEQRPTVMPQAQTVSPSLPPRDVLPEEPDPRQRKLHQFQSLLRATAPAPPGKRNSVIVFASSGPSVDFEPTQLLYGTLVSDTVHFLADPFPTTKPDYFNDIYAGDPDLIKALAASTQADTVAAGRLVYTFKSSASVAHDIVCEVTLTYKVMGATGEVVKTGVVSGGAPSFSESAALQEAVKEIGKQFSVQLAKLL
jgi:hypothetical protein